MNEAKLLALVAAMNDCADVIDPNYGKIALFLTEGKGEDAKSVRYFIQSRPVADATGVERWKFVARQEQ